MIIDFAPSKMLLEFISQIWPATHGQSLRSPSWRRKGRSSRDELTGKEKLPSSCSGQPLLRN